MYAQRLRLQCDKTLGECAVNKALMLHIVLMMFERRCQNGITMD